MNGGQEQEHTTVGTLCVAIAGNQDGFNGWDQSEWSVTEASDSEEEADSLAAKSATAEKELAVLQAASVVVIQVIARRMVATLRAAPWLRRAWSKEQRDDVKYFLHNRWLNAISVCMPNELAKQMSWQK